MSKLFYIGLIIIISSCTLDYSDTGIIENLSEEIPNTVIYNYETVEIQNGSPVLQIQAEKAEVYNSKEQTYLENVNFYNYKDDVINNHGTSESAILNMKSGDAQLSGSIIIESVEEEKSLTADSIFWLESDKMLSSTPSDSVIVKDSDGSVLSGKGFSADIRRKTIIFDGKTKGEYITDEN